MLEHFVGVTASAKARVLFILYQQRVSTMQRQLILREEACLPQITQTKNADKRQVCATSLLRLCVDLGYGQRSVVFLELGAGFLSVGTATFLPRHPNIQGWAQLCVLDGERQVSVQSTCPKCLTQVHKGHFGMFSGDSPPSPRWGDKCHVPAMAPRCWLCFLGLCFGTTPAPEHPLAPLCMPASPTCLDKSYKKQMQEKDNELKNKRS